MNYRVRSGLRRGEVTVPASKSAAQRALICAALSRRESVLLCRGLSRDISAAVRCLNALGAEITPAPGDRLRVRPISERNGAQTRSEAQLLCGESGAALRFLLPVTGALGIPAAFHMEGRLPERPILPLAEVLERHGMRVTREGARLHCAGRLTPGEYTIPGDISSQFVSGLLLALPLLAGESTLRVTGRVESENYITLTEDALRRSGIEFEKRGFAYHIPGGQSCRAPAVREIEGDWSAAAFFLTAGALSPAGVTLRGLAPDSLQGDRAILELLAGFGAEVTWAGDAVTVRRGALRGQVIDASATPDLVPVLAAAAAAAEGETRITRAGRLRLKESDRLKTTAELLTALGAEVYETEDGLCICGRAELAGGTVNAAGDHRIAMAAAVAAGVCRTDVTVLGADCTAKSYPGFWQDLEKLEVIP